MLEYIGLLGLFVVGLLTLKMIGFPAPEGSRLAKIEVAAAILLLILALVISLADVIY